MTNKAFFPSIRGEVGDWVFYSSVLPIQDLATRVGFVKDIHPTAAEDLSNLIQRDVKDKRATDIAKYIKQTDQRFFNSLVLAIYGGVPQWHPATVEPTLALGDTANIRGKVGLLEFSGKEEIIPIDGQHRLAGIDHFLSANNEVDERKRTDFPVYDDLIPVIFVAHRMDSDENLLRTRRLFTTLNKYAVRVNKQEIIAIDEDDPMAITTRWLLEEDPRFCSGRILVKGGANIDIGDSCLTSIENIYDILTILFDKILKKGPKKHLTSMKRPSDSDLAWYREKALLYFECLASFSKEIEKFFKSKNYGAVAKAEREKGNVLFRPVGLKLITLLVARFDGIPLDSRFDSLKDIPLNMNEYPYYKLLISDQNKMLDKNEPKVRSLLLAALGKKLNSIEKGSAKAGIALISGQPKNKIKNSHIPDNIEGLKNISNVASN